MTAIFNRRRTLATMLRIAASIGAATMLSACGGPGIATVTTGTIAPDSQPAARRDMAVALLLPLSGGPQVELLAKQMRQAAELALVEQNVPGLRLIVQDDKATPQGAEAATRTAIKDGASLIVGPLFARSAAAVGPLAKAANVPVVSFSNDVAAAGPDVHLLSFFVADEIDRVIQYASKTGRRRYGALLPEDAFGKLADAAFRSAVHRHGGDIALTLTYRPTNYGTLGDMRQQRDGLRAAAQAGEIDALFLPGSADILPQLATLLRQANVDPAKIKLIGTGGWDEPMVARQPGFAGAWFAGPDPQGMQDFAKRYATAYNTQPSRLAALAHDAMLVATTLAKAGGPAPFAVANIARAEGFVGIDGRFALVRSAATLRSLAVLEVREGRTVVVDPAPAALGLSAANRIASR